MAKGVIINLNSGSDYTDCTIYTGLTETTATGTTEYTSVVGGTVDLSGLDDTLTEVYVKIVCVGCCEQVFYVCLVTPDPTPTPTTSPTTTPTNTPSNTPDVTPSNTPSNTPDVTPSNTPSNTPNVSPSNTPTPTVTPSNSPTPEIPVTNITLYYSYQLLSGGPTYNVYNTTSDLTSAQTVYCDMVNRQNGALINGGVYKHYGPLGVGVQLLTSTLLPAVNVAGYYGTGIPAGIGGVYYYVRTDSNGYVTHHGLVNYCGDSHVISECFNTCVSAECFCDSATSTTVYMQVGYTPLDINNVIYADSACTTPWYGDYEYSNTIYSSNPNIQIICNPGDPC